MIENFQKNLLVSKWKSVIEPRYALEAVSLVLLFVHLVLDFAFNAITMIKFSEVARLQRYPRCAKIAIFFKLGEGRFKVVIICENEICQV